MNLHHDFTTTARTMCGIMAALTGQQAAEAINQLAKSETSAAQMHSESAGGGMWLRVVETQNGALVSVLIDESVMIYPSRQAFDEQDEADALVYFLPTNTEDQ